MSQTTAVRTGRPASRPAVRPTSARGARTGTPLRVVGPADSRSRVGLAVGCLALLGLGLLGLLMLNVSLEKGAYVLRQQQVDTSRLQAQRQALQEQLAALEAPQSLEARARALGMVSAPNVAFVRADGQVLGVPSPGVAAKTPSVTAQGTPTTSPKPSSSARASADPSAKPTASPGASQSTATTKQQSKATGKDTSRTTARTTGKATTGRTGKVTVTTP